MEQGDAVANDADAGIDRDARGARHHDIVQRLRDRAAEDQAAREKRRRGYRQSLKSDAGGGPGASSTGSPVRLYRFRTKVPCRATPEARALLDELRTKFPGSTVSFPQMMNGRQSVMLTGRAGTPSRQIGWVEHRVQADATLCNVRHHGLSVETDGGTMLVLEFRYPRTPTRLSSNRDDGEDVACVDFAEVRPALDVPPSDRVPSPHLVWITRPETEMMDALRSRDYEAFYVRFKLEVQAGIWHSLSTLLSSSPASRWHLGSHYTVVLQPDPPNRKIHVRTVDDAGRVADIGCDRTHDAASATDILLLHLDADMLADIAEIYFRLQSLESSDAYFLKEELFTIIRRFWSSSRSLLSRYGSDVTTVERMSQRAVPMPTQAPLLRQDWTNLRQSLFDRYGEGGRKAADLVAKDAVQSHGGASAWPFESFPAGDVNVGLRVVYRQEWRHAGGPPDEAMRPIAPDPMPLDDVVAEVVKAAGQVMKWPVESGAINIGTGGLAATTDMGIEAECRERSRDTSTSLGNITRTMAGRIGLQGRYETVTRIAAVENVVLVAEKLPAPAEIGLSWVRRHDWILAKALLDESFRDALDDIGQDGLPHDDALHAKRDRLYAHIRGNILHYQRAVWRLEDPQQRSMRYRKSGRRVPLEWRFELESGGALSIDDLGDRLVAPNVDGHFAAYSAGRQADLDQVVDPGGPIGYCGNYAVYHMRPELGSADLFSMLHFFKSPYLRPNAETGEPEVADPELIRSSEDSGVVAASDEVAEPRADDGSHPNDASEEYAVILDSSRGIALLSGNGHREAKPGPAIVPVDDDRMPTLRAGAAAVGACAPATQPVIRARDGGARTSVLRFGEARHPAAERAIIAPKDGGAGVVVGVTARGGRPAAAAILRPHDGRQRILRVGLAHRADPEQAVLSRADGGGVVALVVSGGMPGSADATIRPQVEGAPPIRLHGGGLAPAAERAILARHDGATCLALVAGDGAVHARGRMMIVVSDHEWLRPSKVAR